MADQPKMNMNLIQQMQELEATYFEQQLNAEYFPAAKLTDEWKRVVTISMQKTSPLLMRISLKEFAGVMRCIDDTFSCKPKQISLFEFGVMSNSIETVSPDKLILNPNEYADFIDYCSGLIEYYSIRTKKIREDVHKRAEDDLKRKSLAQGGLKSVRAEA